MKKRYCDQCKREIAPKTDYIKCIKQPSSNGGPLIHIADLCQDCFNKDIQ
jgi:hypothetical protein